MKVISLFSGAGGLDLGFVRAGHRIVWANDNDPDAVSTYRENLGDHIQFDDVTKIHTGAVPSGDILVGGFPCQGFSRANLRRSPSDERNRLYLEFLRFLHDLQPKYFLAENVRGLVTMDRGRVMSMIVEDFADAGYTVEYGVLNAADFGVPQTRIRVFIVGTRIDLATERRFRFPNPTHSRYEIDGRKRWVTLGEALAGVPDPDGSHSLKNHVYSRYKVVPRDFTGHRLTDPDKPSPTVLARGNGKGGVCAIPHPSGRRRLTVRESAIVQTFPSEFGFVGKLNSTYRQVGNAVPVVMAQALAEQFSA